MAFRDNLAKLRSLAGEKSYTLEKAPIRDCWFLISEESGQLAVSAKGTTAFSVQRAIKFLSGAEQIKPERRAMRNPRGRANYEPNSWGTAIGGPRETPEGFVTFPAEADGPKVRLRPESFADHYSQANLFYRSQHPIEQKHIAAALIFELSKVEVPAIRARVVSHLLNIDKTLGLAVADGLALTPIPKPATPAAKPRLDLPISDALSILKNAPGTFKGRKIGVLLTDGVAANLLDAVKTAAKSEKAVVELIAPKIGGVKLKGGKLQPVNHRLDGAPSVLFDAVVILVSESGVAPLLGMPAARDFVADAYAHYKFMGFNAAAVPLLTRTGVDAASDKGLVSIDTPGDAREFLKACRDLRSWDRLDAA